MRTLVANEMVPARAELVRAAVAGVPLDVEVHVGDGRELDPAGLGAPRGFDRILLDAPCTGLGALRRRPEARWRKAPSDVAELTKLQGELFDAAVDALAPGGILAYVTCSPHTAETHGVARCSARPRWRAASSSSTPRAVLAASCRGIRSTSAATPPRCSCGRTGTAPTRCSSRSSRGASRRLTPLDRVAA